MLIDSPYLPDELDALPSLLAGAGFEPDGLLATHADFDHLLGRLAFPGMTLGLAESSVQRMHREPGDAQRALRQYDDEFYVTRSGPARARAGPGAAGARARRARRPRAGAAPGRGPHRGRDGDLRPRPGLLVVGDYLSDVEIPWISEGGSLADYRATLARLGAAGGGRDDGGARPRAPHDRETALRLLEEDVAYLDALERGEQQLPEGRDTKAQRGIHAENVERV